MLSRARPFLRACMSTSAAETVNIADLGSSSLAKAAAAARQLPPRLSDEDFKTFHKQANRLRDMARTFARQPTAEAAASLDDVIAVHNAFASRKRANALASAQLMLTAVNVGHPEKAIEIWVQLLENISLKSAKVSVRDSLKSESAKPAVLAALIAYIATCLSRNVPVDTTTALKLVPVAQVPVSLAPLAAIKGLDSGKLKEYRAALAKLRKESTDFASPEFLEMVARGQYSDVLLLYGEFTEALGSVDLSVQEKIFAAFIRRFSETRQLDKAYEAWGLLVSQSKQNDLKVTVVGWRALLRAVALAPKNAPQLFEQVWKQMEDRNVKPDADCICVKLEVLIRQNKLDEALQIYRNSSVDLGSYGMNIVLTGLARARRFEEVDEMLANPPAAVNDVTFNALISASLRYSKHERTMQYLEIMNQKGIKPDVALYSQVIQTVFALAKRKGTEAADVADSVGNLLAEMRQRKIRPNSQLVTVLAHGISEVSSSVYVPRKLFQSMENSGMPLSVETMGAFISAEIRHGDFVRAKRLFELMARYNLPYSAALYNQQLRGALTDFRDMPYAHATFNKMLESVPRMQPNKFTYMFILQAADSGAFRTDAALKELVQLALSALAKNPTQMDFSVAKRVLALGQVKSEGEVPFFEIEASLLEAAEAVYKKDMKLR